MNNRRLVVAILFLVLARLALLAGFTKVEVRPSSPQIIIYPAAFLALVGLVQLFVYWRRSYRAK